MAADLRLCHGCCAVFLAAGPDDRFCVRCRHAGKKCGICKLPFHRRGNYCTDCKKATQLHNDPTAGCRTPAPDLAERIGRYRELAAAGRELFGEGAA